MLIHFSHGTMCSISSKNSRFFVRACDNSSLKADRLSCLSIPILYHFFRLFELCGVVLSNIALWGAALFVLHGFLVRSISALIQLQQHIISGVCVLPLLNFLVSQLIYSVSCKTDFLTGENCFFTHWERIHLEYQISSFTPTCVHSSLPIIVIAQGFQQDTFIGARQLDFSHNPITFPNFSCALRLFLSKAWA